MTNKTAKPKQALDDAEEYIREHLYEMCNEWLEFQEVTAVLDDDSHCRKVLEMLSRDFPHCEMHLLKSMLTKCAMRSCATSNNGEGDHN